MSVISNLFTPDYERYEGVRPINIYLLRLLYFLMAAFVATDAWMTIINHQGPWDRFMAIAFCVWAAYPTLAVLLLFVLARVFEQGTRMREDLAGTV